MSYLFHEVPLPTRMRPTDLNGFVGQSHLLGPQGILRAVMARGKLPSCVLWGPPGSGKTTLAQIISAQLKGHFESLSAVLAGVKDVREAVEQAKNRLAFGAKTYLFIDEIHRFNRAQQDALLPHVEQGIVTLIGATTENPSFNVNAPLLSRCRVFVLKSLDNTDLKQLLDRALSDKIKGLGSYELSIDEESASMLIQIAQGDARTLLVLLQMAADVAKGMEEAQINKSHVSMAASGPTLRYDKQGEQHYDIISAFIKSMRGSDPEAALYYMVRMLEGGEDPRFVLRRMMILASEDIGNADPQALQVAVAAFQAFEVMGAPEGYIPMAQAVTYLASAPKSNASYVALKKVQEVVKETGNLPVPLHLRNAPSKLMKDLGYGKNYLYPHDFPGGHVAQQYLPDHLAELLKGLYPRP